MGSPISQVAPSTQPQGKNGFPAPRPAQYGRPDGLDQNAIDANPQGFQEWQQQANLFQNQQQMMSPAVQPTGQFQPQGKGGFSSSRGQVMPPEFQKYSSQGPESLVTDARAVYRPDDQIKPPMPANGLINMDIPNKNHLTPEPVAMPSPGKGGNVTFPGQGRQPRMGQPNMYPNTVGQWDNASIQPQQSRNRGGKGKG